MTIAIYGRNLDKDDERVWFLLRRLAAGGARTYVFQGNLEAGTDAVLALGGDGTFLRAINLLRGSSVPIAGINFGRLGFLTSAKVEEGENAWIEDLLQGRYCVQKRILLKVESDAVPHGIYPYALNEFSIQRQNPAMLRIEIGIGEGRLPSYWADGVVVSTPTGSTAYSLSVGGPIVTPDSDVFIIAPIAPHNLNVRPIVTPAESDLTISFGAKSSQKGVVTLDNTSFEVPVGSTFKVTKADYCANCITFNNAGFIDAIKDKLLWGEDKRNTF
ncbi:MAG: NAD(+)/NADH kinase [Bacteroidales bacterium]|nr:NAD(+)/NADH kinase [Bacteroidales bacterium]